MRLRVLQISPKGRIGRINKKMVESLIKCGAFDSLGVYRSQLMAVYEKVLDSISQERRKIYRVSCRCSTV